MPGIKRTRNDDIESSPKRQRSEAAKALVDASNVMLAHSYNPEKYDIADGWLLSEKLDGMRALWDGQRLISRQGNTIHAPDFFLANFPEDMALDGELFAGRGRFNETVSVARQHNAGEKWDILRYVVFDAPSVHAPFERRLAAAKEALQGSKYATVHPHERCRNQAHLEEELERVEAADGEGLMMRKSQSSYDSGRSHNLLKVKTFKDDEAVVIAHQKGKGKHQGRLGALVCHSRTGKEFKIGTGFTDEQREKPPKKGSVVTFRYFEITKAGVPRFPAFMRIRPDVSADEFSMASS